MGLKVSEEGIAVRLYNWLHLFYSIPGQLSVITFSHGEKKAADSG